MKGLRVLHREVLYRGRVFDLIKERLEVFGHPIVREIIRHPGAVVIVPVLNDAQVVFVQQYRRAVNRMLLELPAGTLAKEESRAACARRELEEETGWRASHLRRIGHFYPAPGFASEEMTVFLARGLRHVGSRPEPDELVTPVILSFREAFEQIASGMICDGKSIIGILLAKRYLNVA